MWTYRVPGSSSSNSAPAASIIRLSLFLLALAPACAHARFPFEKWECGSEDYSKQLSHSEVMQQCPHFAEELNHCCVVHDDCYGRKKGQAFCDDQFNVCNKRVLEDERAGPCATLVEMAYVMVSMFGDGAYGASANYTEPHESELQLCRPEKTVGVFFDYLYLSCPTIKKSISSCCDQLTVCPDLPLGRNRTECANRAMRCLSAARADEHHGFNDGHCDRALDRTRKYLALDYIAEGDATHHAKPKGQHGPPELFANSNQAFVLLMVLSMLCGVCLLLVTYKYYRLRNQNKDRKYSTITLSVA